MKRSRNSHGSFPGVENKPWLDLNGNPRSDTELKELSKTWSPETWEAYLTSLESCERHYLARDFQKLLAGSRLGADAPICGLQAHAFARRQHVVRAAR